MKRFAAILTKINEKLNLPQPLKSRILLEMAGDLDDLFNHYRSQGLDEIQAQQKAEEMLRADEETLSLLVQVHDSGFRKFLNRLSEQAQTRWERLCLFLVVAVSLILSGKEIFSFRFFTNTSHFIWPILLISLLLFILTLIKFYMLYIKKNHRITKLHSGSFTFLFLCGLCLLVGVGGFLIELYLAGSHVASSADSISAGIVWGGIRVALITTIFGLVIFTFSSIAWFILRSRFKELMTKKA